MKVDLEFSCTFCHESSLEIIINDRHGFMLMCNECGFTKSAQVDQLVAAR